MNSQDNRSISELIGATFNQLSMLVKTEFDLARAELSEKASIIGRAGVMIGAGATLLIPALVIFLFSVAEGLVQLGLSDAAAYLLTSVISAAVSFALIWLGVGRLSPKTLKPNVTLEQMSKDKAAAKEMVR